VKKVIVHSHNNDIGSDAHFLKLIGHKMCRRLFSNFIDVKLACSDLAAKWLFYDESHQEIQIVNNGIDSEKFRFSEEERKRIREDLQLDDEFVIGNVGRLQQQKNQGFLIDVFADIVDKNSSARLLIVGEGEDELFLKNKAIELGLEEKIIFYGFTTKMSSVLSAMDVFVLPSLFEGFGIVNIEAQANGLPCVVSDNMPTSVCLSDDFIFLSLTESRQRWVNSILKFGNYKRDLQKNNETISKIKEVGYDIKEVAKQMEMIYLS
jgi:glycosyltransferase involved in cell wall biosynthesis